MFDAIKNAFRSLGSFISGLFESFWSGILTIIVLICFTALLITLIVTYQKNHKEEIHVIDTSNQIDKELKEQNKANEKV